MIMTDKRQAFNKQSFLNDDSEQTVTPPVLSEKVDIMCELVGGCRLSKTTNKDSYEDIDACSWMPYCVVERQGKVIHKSLPATGGGTNPSWTISTGSLFLMSILTTTTRPSDLKISVWTNKTSSNAEDEIPLFLGQARLSDVAWLANPKERTVELDLLDQFNELSCGGTLALRLRTATEADLRLVQMVHKLHSLLQKVGPPSINNDSDDDDDKAKNMEEQTENSRHECLRERAQNLIIRRQRPILKEALAKQAEDCREEVSFSDENLENMEPDETKIKKEPTKPKKSSVLTSTRQPIVIGKEPKTHSKEHPVTTAKTSAYAQEKMPSPLQSQMSAITSTLEVSTAAEAPPPTNISNAQRTKVEQPSFSMPLALSSLVWAVYAIEQLDSSYPSFLDLTAKSNAGSDKDGSIHSYWNTAIQQLIPSLPSPDCLANKYFNRNRRRQQQQHLQLEDDVQISAMSSLVNFKPKRSSSSSTFINDGTSNSHKVSLMIPSTMTRMRNTRHYLTSLLVENPSEETLLSFWLTFAILLGEMTTFSRQEGATTVTMNTSSNQLYLESTR